MTPKAESRERKNSETKPCEESRGPKRFMEYERLGTSFYFGWQWISTHSPVFFSALIVLLTTIHGCIFIEQKNIMHEQSAMLNKSIQEAIRTREIENRAYVNVELSAARS